MNKYTSSYKERVQTLLKDQSSSLFLGLIVVVALMGGVLYFNSNSPARQVAEIPQESRDTINKPSATKTYTVQEGEGLWQVAEKVYGDGNYWPKIQDANKMTDPNAIYTGMVLNIPEIGIPSPTTTPAQVTSPDGENGQVTGGMTGKANTKMKSYTVKDGEGLFQIAEKIYGDGNMWPEIAKKNNIANPDNVEVGTVLKIN